MKIKVCGITQIEQLIALQALGIDYAGLIFVPSSKRFIDGKIPIAEVLTLADSIKKVGVFANQSLAEILENIGLYQLNAVQLHGDESPKLCNELRTYTKVWKVIHVQSSLQATQAQLDLYDTVCDQYLLDTQTAAGQRGGTGLQFNWELLHQLKFSKPFVLSGGIGLADVETIKALKHPQLAIVDVNSKFEIAPGIKDLHQIQQFQQALLAVTE